MGPFGIDSRMKKSVDGKAGNGAARENPEWEGLSWIPEFIRCGISLCDHYDAHGGDTLGGRACP